MFRSHDLIFRKACESDLDKLYELKQESWESTHHIAFVNMFDQKKFLESLQTSVTQPASLLLIACSDIQKPLGCFFVSNIDYVSRSADVSWAMFRAFRNKGFGRSLVGGGCNICINALNLRRLTCEILEGNVASQKCADASMFCREGVKRNAVFKMGTYTNSLVYGLLSGSFQERPITPFSISPNIS